MEHATPNGRRDGARELRGHRASGERSHRRAGPPGQPAGTPRRCLVRRRPATVRDRPRPRSGSAGADGQGGRGLAEGRLHCRRRCRARGRAAQRLGGGRHAPGGGPCRRGRGNRSPGRAASRLGGHAAAGQSRAPACRGPPRASRAAAAPAIRDRGPRGRGPHAANLRGGDRPAGLDVEYTRVRAPFNGGVVNLNISTGAFARSGTEVFTLVDTGTWYVMANFRETQLRHIPAGAPVDLYLQSHPGRHFRGTVVGLGWAVLPENGTSVNGLPRVERSLDWIRLAARFPVRIKVENPDESFRIGASAVATVHGSLKSESR